MTNLSPYFIFDDRIIIDYILLFSNYISTIFHYFSCVVPVFTKYRAFFKLNKCDLYSLALNMLVKISMIMVISPLC